MTRIVPDRRAGPPSGSPKCDRPPRAVGYAQVVSENPRIERGWIFVDGTRRDDGTIELGTGDEMRFSPFDAISDRQDTHITWQHILKASVQRLAFWRR
jgi:hypothetical protein